MIFVNEPLTQNHLIVFFSIVAAVFHSLFFLLPWAQQIRKSTKNAKRKNEDEDRMGVFFKFYL